MTEELRTPAVAYLGDSAPPGLDDNPAMYEAEILICELTFVAPDHRKEHIHKFGHMHLDDFVERRDRFKNELIIAGHLSTRYHPNAVREMVAAGASRHARRPADVVAVGGKSAPPCGHAPESEKATSPSHASDRSPTPASRVRTPQRTCGGRSSRVRSRLGRGR